MSQIIAHIDFDHFYAQCEETRKPSLRIAPLVICVFSGRAQNSGAVATANYVARRYNVKSGMSIRLAQKYLKNVTGSKFLPVDFEFYESISKRAMTIMEGFADIFEYVGRDEAYLDITSRSSQKYNTARHIVQQIKNDIRIKLSLTCSVGISSNKLVSKIASAYKKPDGLTLVEPNEIKDFLASQSIRVIPGLGKRAEYILKNMNIKTISDLCICNAFDLIEKFGRKTGTYLYNAAQGIDDSPVTQRGLNLQYSKIITLEHDSTDVSFIQKSLPGLCSNIQSILVAKSQTFRTVGIHLIGSDMFTKSRSIKLRIPTSSLQELERAATSLLYDVLETQKTDIRRIGVKVSDLSNSTGQRSIDDYY